MITYINTNNEVYYDFNMIMDLLHFHPSYLKRVIKKYGFTPDEYIKYKNRHLYTQNALVDFIIFIVKQKTITDARKIAATAYKNKNKDEL